MGDVMMMRRLMVGLVGLAFVISACSSPGPEQQRGRLVFERDVDGNTDVYAMDVDGGNLVRLTDSPGWDGTPRWSPDGTTIVFASERLGAPAIFVMDADGTNVVSLTDGSSPSLMPAWSPDGSQIAFVSTQTYQIQMQGGRQEVDAGFELWVMDADGTNHVRVTGNPDDQSLYPTWAPDASRIAYMQVGDDVRIHAKAPDETTGSTVLSDGLEGRHWTPAWSPNGDVIAIMAQQDGTNDIWLIRPDGGEAINITNSDSADVDPAWSPDGTFIVFISNRDGPASLYITDVEGTSVRRLTSDAYDYARPDWTAQ